MYALELLHDDAEEVFVELLVAQRELCALLRRAGGGVEAREQPRELEPAVEGIIGRGHGGCSRGERRGEGRGEDGVELAVCCCVASSRV